MLLFVTMAIPGVAEAMRCPGPRTSEEVRTSTDVFSGTVVSFDNALLMIDVEHVYKGGLTRGQRARVIWPDTRMTAHGTTYVRRPGEAPWCHPVRPTVGTRYIVLARLDHGALRIGRFSRSNLRSRALGRGIEASLGAVP